VGTTAQVPVLPSVRVLKQLLIVSLIHAQKPSSSAEERSYSLRNMSNYLQYSSHFSEREQ
jgi:hypothetical protein